MSESIICQWHVEESTYLVNCPACTTAACGFQMVLRTMPLPPC